MSRFIFDCWQCLNRSADLDDIWPVHLPGPADTVYKMGSLTTSGGRDLGSDPDPKHATPNCCCHLANRNEEQFRLLPNYFGLCFL